MKKFDSKILVYSPGETFNLFKRFANLHKDLNVRIEKDIFAKKLRPSPDAYNHEYHKRVPEKIISKSRFYDANSIGVRTPKGLYIHANPTIMYFYAYEGKDRGFPASKDVPSGNGLIILDKIEAPHSSPNGYMPMKNMYVSELAPHVNDFMEKLELHLKRLSKELDADRENIKKKLIKNILG